MVNADAGVDLVSETPIHQSLHGYAEGHTLLAASCDLSTAEKKRLLLMSDLSGSPFHPAFQSYLTGYPLPGQRYYAFARTWYANEMRRPGCVWTHTLLIDIAYLGQLRRLDLLNTLFSRPQRDSYSAYLSPIFWSSKNTSTDLEIRSEVSFELYEQIADNLYSNPAKKLLIQAEKPDLYESVILTIWGYQWPRLRRNFSFCSGSLSLRFSEGISLDCQVIPYSLSLSSVLNTTDDLILMASTKASTLSSWVNLMRQIPADQLLGFMYQYGSDVRGVRSRFLPLLYAYQLQYKNQLETTSFESLFRFLAKSFPLPEEAIQLKKELITQKLEQDAINTYHFVETWLTSEWTSFISGLNWDIATLISQLWHNNICTTHQISLLLQRANPSRLTDANKIAIIQNLPIRCWLEVDWIDIALISSLLVKNYKPKDFGIVWQASLPIQQRWIQALEFVDRVDWLAINDEMLTAGNASWAETIIQHTGSQAVLASLDWSSRIDRTLPIVWEKIIAGYGGVFFNWLARQDQLTDYSLRLIVKLFNTETIPLISAEPSVWALLAKRLLNNSTAPSSIQAATLLFSSCLFQNSHNTIEVLVILFELLHERARVLQLDEYSWRVLKSLVDKSSFAKQTGGFWSTLFFRKENSPAHWDRCEYLRQITANYYISHDWSYSAFSRMIVNEDTFKRVVNYSVSFPEGRAYISNLKRYLKAQSSETSRKQLAIIHQEQ